MVMNKLGEEDGNSVLGTLVAIILAILVLIVIFYFLFHQQIWDFFRNLPGYKYDNKDSVIIDLPKDEKILVNYYKAGVIKDGKYIQICLKGDCNNLADSSLYISGNEKQGVIYADINWGIDKRVGEIVNNRIILDKEILEQEGSVYDKVKENIPSHEDMLNLDYSMYISGILYKDKGVKINDKK